MVKNISEKDKTLQEVIDWCSDWAKEICSDMGGDYYADFMQVAALTKVIDHCRAKIGYSGSMPTEVPNQSEDAK